MGVTHPSKVIIYVAFVRNGGATFLLLGELWYLKQNVDQ